MIVNALLGVVLRLVSLLLTPIHIPSLPEGVSSAIAQGFTYITDGLSIIAAFTHWDFLCGLFWAAVAIEVAMIAYKFVMWIIKKIPVSME